MQQFRQQIFELKQKQQVEQQMLLQSYQQQQQQLNEQYEKQMQETLKVSFVIFDQETPDTCFTIILTFHVF